MRQYNKKYENTVTFVSTDIRKINDNFVQLIGYDWMLITAGKPDDYNTMTAAWGSIGFLWKKPVAMIFIRPQRHTFQFVEKYEDFSLSFFDRQYRQALDFCGSHSGRDTDKAGETGLTLAISPSGILYFEQARMVIECRKVYFDDIKPAHFLDSSIGKNYPLKDYHRMYIGFITACRVKQGQP